MKVGKSNKIYLLKLKTKRHEEAYDFARYRQARARVCVDIIGASSGGA